ncbi:unnamed protein product [Lactuca saligna]|uniref:Ubiquitin-like protease family profile domain-containing protein n=1 Tax=Lactuca saligna TaxID=75948 RepID=A0AA35VWJ0_LACSI|nr:unnamed protein product [Lactuca saligna]
MFKSLEPEATNACFKSFTPMFFTLNPTLYSDKTSMTGSLYASKHCPVQHGSTECGYYMLRFMKEIVEEGIEVLVKDNIGDGKVEYTPKDIDEIREEWSEFVTGFIYR